MSIVHAKSNTVGDFTGTVTVYNSAGSTVTANATDLVRPSDWNSAHSLVYALGGNTAGSSQLSGTDIRFDGGANLTISADTLNGRMIFSAASQSTHSHSTAPGAIAAGTQTATSGTVVFADSNGLTWGMSGSSQITAAYSQSTHSHSTAPGAIAAGTQTATSGTIVWANSNGITFGMSGSSQVTASHNGLTTARASNDAVGLNTAFTAGPLAWTVNSSGISLNASSAAGTTSGFTGGASISGSMTHNTAGLALSLSHPAWLTTAAQSIHGHTITVSAQSNTTQASSGTLDMAGLNVQGAGIVSVGVSNNSLIISAAGGGGGVTPVASASNGSFSFTTLAFSNANNVTFGTSAGSIITASVAAPGAAAEQNAINLLGANTAGNTTATGSTIGWSGVNVTLSGTNASQVVISAPATSSLVGDRGISISTAGSTISIRGPVLSYLYLPDQQFLTNVTGYVNNSMLVQNKMVQQNISATQLILPVNIASVATAANTSSAGINFTVSCAIYTENANTLSSLSSTTFTTFGSWTSNGTNNMTGGMLLTAPFNVFMTPSEYYVGLQVSTAATGGGLTGAATTSLANTVSMLGAGTAIMGAFSFRELGSTTNNSVGYFEGGFYSGTNSFTGGIALSDVGKQGISFQRALFAMQLKA